MLAPDDAAARNNLAELLLDAGCLDESRKQIERAAALAEGTSLAPSGHGEPSSRSMRQPRKSRAASSRTAPGRTEPEPQTFGGTFAFRRNRFIGSYFALSVISRSRISRRSSRGRPAERLVRIGEVRVETARQAAASSFQAARIFSTFASAPSGLVPYGDHAHPVQGAAIWKRRRIRRDACDTRRRKDRRTA